MLVVLSSSRGLLQVELSACHRLRAGWRAGGVMEQHGGLPHAVQSSCHLLRVGWLAGGCMQEQARAAACGAFGLPPVYSRLV